MSGDFVEVSWRSGLGAGSHEAESETFKNEAGSRRRRKRGAGGRLRCVCWPQGALCGCAALKSAHLTSPQTVSATVQNNKPKSELFLFFSTADAVDGGQDRAQLTGLVPRPRGRPGCRARRAKRDRPCPCAIPRRTPVQTDDQRHCCGGGGRGAMSVDERVILLESGFDVRYRGVKGSRGREASREARGKVADYDVRSGTSCCGAGTAPGGFSR